MRILHTSDWHLGKGIRGLSRMEEHREATREIVRIAAEEQADLVLVTGDLFESSAPPPQAQALAWGTLLGLRRTGARVVVLAGNHDNPHHFEAMRRLMAELTIEMAGVVREPDEGGVLRLETPSGEVAQVAVLPFLSQRGIVRASDLMSGDTTEHAATYSSRMADLIDRLTRGFHPGTVNLVAAHCMVAGGRLGGGERDAQTIFPYYVEPSAFGNRAQYVALGHLHRMQEIPAPVPARFAGSILPLDFSEEEDEKVVVLVDVRPGSEARVREIPLHAGRRLRTVRGTLEEVLRLAPGLADAWVRVYLEEKPRPGLADAVAEHLPQAVQIHVTQAPEGGPAPEPRTGKSPQQLFSDFLEATGAPDSSLEALFQRLLDEELTGEDQVLPLKP